MKKITLFFISLILISCSQKEAGDNELIYNNGLVKEISSGEPFTGIVRSNFSKTNIKDGIPVSGERYYKDGQLRLSFEIGDTRPTFWKKKGEDLEVRFEWQLKITECFHKTGVRCMDTPTWGPHYLKPDGNKIYSWEKNNSEYFKDKTTDEYFTALYPQIFEIRFLGKKVERKWNSAFCAQDSNPRTTSGENCIDFPDVTYAY